MCTTFKYKKCMGRNFDYEVSYDEELRFIESMEFYNEFKVIGMCTGLVSDYPLLYDGMNEKGLCVSALAFEGNAVYYDKQEDKVNIPAFDFVFQILGSFKSVEDVKMFLGNGNVNITNESYSDELQNSDLHWFICDSEDAIIVESTKEGLMVYDSVTDALTNNPTYMNQLKLCEDTLSIIGVYPEPDNEYSSRGVNTYGLLGDYTSYSRFSRITYLKSHLQEYSKDAFDDVVQAFHLLSSIEQIYGLTYIPKNDKFEYTIYSVVYDFENLNVYLKFYNDLEVRKHGMSKLQ